MEKKIELSGKTYLVRELTIEDGLDYESDVDSKTKAFNFTIKCIEPKMTIEEFKKLSFKDGISLINAANEVNGILDFPKPTNSD